MDARTYFRASLALPLLVPLVAGAVTRAVPGAEQGIAGLLALSGVFGGVPYAVTAALLLWWTRGMDARQMARLTWIAPLVMVPIAFLGWNLYFTLSSGARDDTVPFAAWLCGFVLVFGYGYVLFVNAGFWLLRSTGAVRT